jgi:hypothetical protein
MLIFSRTSFLLLLAFPVAAQAADNPAQPAAFPVAAPAFVDVVTFEFKSEGLNHKVVVTSSPNLLRVDEPDDRFSIIYNPQTDFYTGLEHGNDTYWEFSWPEVRAAVENSKRYEKRIQDLGNEGLTSDNPPPTTNAASVTSTTDGDDSGYVWRATTDKKRIADLDCVRWIGDTVSGENVEVWCYGGLLPKVQTAVAALRTINEPIALVPVRTIAPDFIFPVFDALIKGGVTPVLITWGDDQQEKNYFRFAEAQTRDGKLSLFTVPKFYTKTTLVTMDGIVNEQPAPPAQKNDQPKTWQN